MSEVKIIPIPSISQSDIIAKRRQKREEMLNKLSLRTAIAQKNLEKLSLLKAHS